MCNRKYQLLYGVRSETARGARQLYAFTQAMMRCQTVSMDFRLHCSPYSLQHWAVICLFRLSNGCERCTIPWVLGNTLALRAPQALALQSAPKHSSKVALFFLSSCLVVM